MIALYRRQAKTAAEPKLGWLKPLHEVIPSYEMSRPRDWSWRASPHCRLLELRAYS